MDNTRFPEHTETGSVDTEPFEDTAHTAQTDAHQPNKGKDPAHAELREKLIALAEKGEIKHTTAYIKKANAVKIMVKYTQEQTESVNEYFSETLINKFSEAMDSARIVEDGKSTREEVADNELLKKDIKKLAGYITPYIPMIGLFCGGLVVAKHWYTSSPKTEPTITQLWWRRTAITTNSKR